MEQLIAFPGLGLEFTLDSVAFYLPQFLGSRPIRWYGIFIALGFLLAIIYIDRRSKTFGLDPDKTFNVTFTAVILGVIGARLYYVIFSGDNYMDDPLRLFRISEGGLAIYGGIIFGILGIILGCKLFKVKLLPMLDLAVGSVLLGQAIGRWGNFTNVEAFGGNTTLPWGMTSPTIVNYLTYHQVELEKIGMLVDPNMPVHPTFFYESIWCLAGFLLIALITKKRRYDGQLTLVYLGWYGLGRFFIEGLRTDSLMVKHFRISQLVALACFIITALILVVMAGRVKRKNDPEYLPLYVTTEDSRMALAPKEKNDADSSSDDADSSSDDAESSGDDAESSSDDADEVLEVAEALIEDTPEDTVSTPAVESSENVIKSTSVAEILEETDEENSTDKK